MINDLAIDNVFNNFACDGCEGDRSVVSGIMPTVLLVYWCNMCLFPSVLVFCRAERYFCRTRGRNRGESISAIVSAISAGEKWQKSSKPDKIVLD